MRGLCIRTRVRVLCRCVKRMGRPERYLTVLLLSAAGLLTIRLLDDGHRHTFGHAHLVDWATVVLLALLATTHLAIAVIMWIQRARWLPSDGAMFLWIGAKAELWANTASVYMLNAGQMGIRFDYVYLYVLVFATTLHLDIRMVRRYVLFTDDEREDAVLGIGPKDRRAA